MSYVYMQHFTYGLNMHSYLSQLVHVGGGCCKTGICHVYDYYSDVACHFFGDCCFDILAISCGELMVSFIQMSFLNLLYYFY